MDLLRQAVTVYNLGGVPMGETADRGVIDAGGEVHGYPQLYVVDGSTVPSATGVNPSATIAVMAERNVEQAIRKLTGEPRWQAPETEDVQPMIPPEDSAMAEMAHERLIRSGDGVKFHERLRGTLEQGHRDRAELILDLDVGRPDGARSAPTRLTPWWRRVKSRMRFFRYFARGALTGVLGGRLGR